LDGGEEAARRQQSFSSKRRWRGHDRGPEEEDWECGVLHRGWGLLFIGSGREVRQPTMVFKVDGECSITPVDFEEEGRRQHHLKGEMDEEVERR
jgi:hypothetical protein